MRAGFCDSWALVSWVPDRYRPNDAQYIRDTWMKESLRDMGQPSSYGHFVHLYVDGLYFGLYNLSERIAEDFFADHLGGRPEDWEINEDLSSPGARWRAMMALEPSTLLPSPRMPPSTSRRSGRADSRWLSTAATGPRASRPHDF